MTFLYWNFVSDLPSVWVRLVKGGKNEVHWPFMRSINHLWVISKKIKKIKILAINFFTVLNKFNDYHFEEPSWEGHPISSVWIGWCDVPNIRTYRHKRNQQRTKCLEFESNDMAICSCMIPILMLSLQIQDCMYAPSLCQDHLHWIHCFLHCIYQIKDGATQKFSLLNQPYSHNSRYLDQTERWWGNWHQQLYICQI